MARGAVSRADLLRALVRQDGDLPSDAIEALGFNTATAKPKQTDTRADREGSDSNRTETQQQLLPDRHLPLAPIPFWQAASFEIDEIEVPLKTGSAANKELPVRPPVEPPEYVYLAPFSELVPRLRAALSERRASRAYDIPRIVEQVGRGKHLQRLPRGHRSGWGSNLYVIEDRSDHLAPYVRDQLMVQVNLQRFYVKTGFFSALYSEFFDWPLVQLPDGSIANLDPQPGDQVLVLGDLGALAEDDGRASAFWAEFGNRMSDRGVAVLALLPCSPVECPTETAEPYRLLCWEHPAPSPLTADEREKRGQHLLEQLSIASRVEPGLLREVRLSLGSALYPAGMEAWVWQHPLMDEPDMVSTSLKSESVPGYRMSFEDDEAHRLRTLSAVKGWLRHLPYEIWLETVTELLGCDWIQDVVDSSERKDAVQLLEYLAESVMAQDGDTLDHEARIWIEGFVARLGERVGVLDETRQTVWHLRAAVDRWRKGLPPPTNGQPRRFLIQQQGGELIFLRQEVAAPAGSYIAALESRDNRTGTRNQVHIRWD